MKKFLKLVFHSQLGCLIRKVTGFRPPIFLFQYQKQFLASDLFIWRTDEGFETLFNASDILGKFYGLRSKLYFLFFDAQGNFVHSKECFFCEGMVSFLIDKNFIGQEGGGTFCVFNIPLERHHVTLSVTNRCYVGYGKNEEFSMLHGNMHAIMITDPYAPIETILDRIRPAVSERKSNFSYHIQKKFAFNAASSLWFVNPLKRRIKVAVGSKSIHIEPRGCGFIEIAKTSINDPPIVKSDFCFARPIVFCKKEGFIDCHHG